MIMKWITNMKKLTVKQKAFGEFLKRLAMSKQGECINLVPNNGFEKA